MQKKRQTKINTQWLTKHYLKKLQIEQRKPHLKPGVNSGVSER